MAEGNAPRGFMASARQALGTARLTPEAGDYAGSVNRSYDAIFYAANALLERDGLQRSKHSAVLSVFREMFVKSGKIAPSPG